MSIMNKKIFSAFFCCVFGEIAAIRFAEAMNQAERKKYEKIIVQNGEMFDKCDMRRYQYFMERKTSRVGTVKYRVTSQPSGYETYLTMNKIEFFDYKNSTFSMITLKELIEGIEGIEVIEGPFVFLIPASVKHIECCNDKNENLTKLQNNLVGLTVLVDNEVHEIYGSAFRNCINLVSIECESKTPQNPTDREIFWETFLECKQKNVFPFLKRIGYQAFSGCKNLKTMPFNEDTPLEEIEPEAFKDVVIHSLILPKTLKSIGSFAFSYIHSVFIPKGSHLKYIDSHCFGDGPFKIIIDREMSSGELISILQRFKEIVTDSLIKSNHYSSACISLGSAEQIDPTNPLDLITNKQYQYIKDSILLIKNKIYTKEVKKEIKKPECYKIFFSSSRSLEELAESAYNKYDLQKDSANDGYDQFLSCFPTELALYALSQESGDFLKSQTNEEKRSLFYKFFVVVRFCAGLPCFDLFEACPDLELSPEFIRKFFLRKRAVEEEINASTKEFIDAFQRDDLEFLSELVEKGNYPLDERPSGTSGYQLAGKSPHVFHDTPEDLYPIELAALFGAIKIFKYLMLKKVKIPDSIWDYALYGGHPEIIHILEDSEQQIKELKKFCSYKDRSINLPYRHIINYLHNNYDYPYNFED